ncbi:MAG TPA: alpha/beta fold hydrolase [Vicinamibacterales bacterium]|nr:alpha/beta fold hydrolase [Vicinamibacterales bacterium]
MADYDTFALGDFPLQSAATLWQAQLAYKTYGTLSAAGDNVVLIPTFYASQHTDCELMFAPGRAIDPAKHFIVVVNMFGNGLSSSPSTAAPPIDRGSFPRVTIYDNVIAQHRLLTERLGIRRIRLVAGFSMGAQQAFHWAALFPEMVAAIAPICGSAKTSPHNMVFLEGLKAALTADAAFNDGWYGAPPVKGLIAFARVYAGWVYSQDFYRQREYTKLGLSSTDDVLRFSEQRYRSRDANDLLAMLWTWQHADVSANERFQGDFSAALQAMRGRAIVMPSETDLYFRVRDNEIEVRHMPNAALRTIPSIWGHAAGRGTNPVDNAFIDAALAELLT